MKYLFVVNDAGSRENANLDIALSICREIEKENEVLLFSLNDYVTQRTFFFSGFWTYAYGPSSKTAEIIEKCKKERSISTIIHAISSFAGMGGILRVVVRKVTGERRVGIIAHFAAGKVKKICKRMDIDMVIGVCFPVTSIHILERLTNTNAMLIQLDPYHSNVTKKASLLAWRLKHELGAHDNAQRIFMTKLICEDYGNSPLSKYRSKWRTIEFPGIRQHDPSSQSELIKFPVGAINLVYCGTLDVEYRDPTYAINLLSNLGDKFRLHFVGRDCKKVVESLTGIDKSNIATYDAVSNDEIYKVMNGADVLVNIGNKMTNQMPSKIIDYMSTGKPILNIAKDRQCCTLAYTERYPACLDVIESEGISPSVVSATEAFCIRNRGHVIPFHEVERIFPECTPSHVAGIIEGTN